jgi:hypothetical protein
VSDREEIIIIVTAVRRIIGFAASQNHVICKSDLDDMYAGMCRLSELLDIPTVQEMRKK